MCQEMTGHLTPAKKKSCHEVIYGLKSATKTKQLLYLYYLLL